MILQNGWFFCETVWKFENGGSIIFIFTLLSHFRLPGMIFLPLVVSIRRLLSARVIGDLPIIALSERLRHSRETIFNVDVLFVVGDTNGNSAIQFFGFNSHPFDF